MKRMKQSFYNVVRSWRESCKYTSLQSSAYVERPGEPHTSTLCVHALCRHKCSTHTNRIAHYDANERWHHIPASYSPPHTARSLAKFLVLKQSLVWLCHRGGYLRQMLSRRCLKTIIVHHKVSASSRA